MQEVADSSSAVPTKKGKRWKTMENAKPVAIEEHTFGGSRAAEVLAAILNEIGDRRMAKRVGSLWGYYSGGIHCIRKGIQNVKFRDRFLSIWYQHCHDVLENTKLPNKIKSHLTNIEKTLLKRVRRGDFGDEITLKEPQDDEDEFNWDDWYETGEGV